MGNNTIECSRIKVGSCFNEPVYFDDGENMFLAANHPAKQYHVAALKRWNIPFLLTSGIEIDYQKLVAERAQAAEMKAKAAASKNASVSNSDGLEDLEELEELEEL